MFYIYKIMASTGAKAAKAADAGDAARAFSVTDLNAADALRRGDGASLRNTDFNGGSPAVRVGDPDNLAESLGAPPGAANVPKKTKKQKMTEFFKENKAYILTAGGVAVLTGIILDKKFTSDAEQACVKDCLPTNYSESEESGLGTLSRSEMIYQGGDKACNAQHADCAEYCGIECNEDSLVETAAGAAGDAVGATAGAAAGAAGGAAGTGLKAFLDGIFGAGMGIPAAIGIVVFIIIIMIMVM
jgi:hypothetical protein